jgi:hypothetical protein
MGEVKNMGQSISKMEFQLKEIRLNLDEQHTVSTLRLSEIDSAACEVSKMVGYIE